MSAISDRWYLLFISSLVMTLCMGLFAYSATRISLNGEWQFALDKSGEGEKLGWSGQLAGSTEAVIVPHSWNLGKYADYEGTAWYFKSFTLPDEVRAKHVELHF